MQFKKQPQMEIKQTYLLKFYMQELIYFVAYTVIKMYIR